MVSGDLFSDNRETLMAVWDAENGQLIGKTESLKDDADTAQSDDGRTILVLPVDTFEKPSAQIQLYRIDRGQSVSTKLSLENADDRTVGAVAVAPDGSAAAAGFTDGSMVVWSATEAGSGLLFRIGEAAVRQIAFSHGGALIAAADDNNTIWLVDRKARTVAASVTLPERVVKLGVAPQGGHLVALTTDGVARVMALSETWQMVGRGVTSLGPQMAPDGGNAVHAHLLFTPGRDLIAAGMPNGKATMWGLDQGKTLAVLDTDHVAVARPDHTVSANDTPFTGTIVDEATGAIISKSRHADDSARGSLDLSPPVDFFVDWQISADARRAIGSRVWLGYFDKLNGKDALDNGDTLSIADFDDAPRILLDTGTGRELTELKLDGFKVDQIGFSQDGHTVVGRMISGERLSEDSEKLMAVWDAETGQLIGKTQGLKGKASTAQSDDGRTILVVRGLFRHGPSAATPTAYSKFGGFFAHLVTPARRTAFPHSATAK
jgi:WD40 repeat protein